MDILILVKEADGSVDAMELSDIAELGELARLETQLVKTLASEDVAHLAAAMDPGSVAGVLVYENLWAAPFASAMRRAGGQLIANGRIPIQALIAAVEADRPPSKQKESDMPLGPGRAGRGVIGAPVAKAAVVDRCRHSRSLAGRQGRRRRRRRHARSLAGRQGRRRRRRRHPWPPPVLAVPIAHRLRADRPRPH